MALSNLRISVRTKQVIRSAVDPNGAPVVYNVTMQGVEGSLRRPQDGFVNVGRQQLNEYGQRPNDIMLPASDRAISRCHCRFNYQHCFRARDLSPQLLAFLMAAHPRLGCSSEFNSLPQHLFYYIYSFFKEPYALWLSDLGSICGTYLRVSHDVPTEIRRGMVFLIGSDIIIDVEEVVCFPLPSLPSEGSEDALMQTLKEAAQPSVRVTIGKIPDSEDSTVHKHSQVFLAERPTQTFLIGRSNTCDLKLNDSTISRTQCRIVYAGERWMLLDGLEAKPSVNGTWLSICQKERGARQESPAVAVEWGAQVKISETVLQVTWDLS